MLFLVVAWSLLLMIFFQLGSTLLDFTKSSCFEKIGDRFIVSVWLGIIIFSNILLALSIFYHLSLLVLLLVSIGLGLLSLILSRRFYILSLKPYLTPGLVLGLLALLLSTSFVATQVVTWYDTGHYHFGIIKWLSRYGSVPGVALIYYAFGYTSSWFALAAPFNQWLLEARASTLTGGLAFLIATVHVCICLTRIITNRAHIQDWFLTIASLLAFTVILRYEIHVSPSTDLPVIILTLIIGWSLVVIANPSSRLPSKAAITISNDALVPLMLAAGAVSIKLTALPSLLVCIVYYLASNRTSINRLLVGMAVVSLILLPFFVVQALTSGCLLYPSSLLCLDLPWTIGHEKIAAVSEQIRKAAQWSTITPPSGSSWSWFFPWVLRQKYQSALVVFALSSLLLSIRKLRLNRIPTFNWSLALGLCGFFYTMLIGPTWRYTLGYLSIITAVFPSLLLVNRDSILRHWLISIGSRIAPKSAAVILLVVISILIPTASALRNNLQAFNFLRIEIRDSMDRGTLSTDSVRWSRLILPPAILNFKLEVQDEKKFSFIVSDLELVEKKVNDISFFKPKSGNQCWNAEIPCTYFLTHDDIRLREADAGLRGGFVRANDH